MKQVKNNLERTKQNVIHFPRSVSTISKSFAEGFISESEIEYDIVANHKVMSKFMEVKNERI